MGSQLPIFGQIVQPAQCQVTFLLPSPSKAAIPYILLSPQFCTTVSSCYNTTLPYKHSPYFKLGPPSALSAKMRKSSPRQPFMTQACPQNVQKQDLQQLFIVDRGNPSFDSKKPTKAQ
jgi:hypothetical protein